MARFWRILIPSLILSVTTIVVYWQVPGHDFVSYDDPTYVRDNANIQNGFSIESLRWAFRTGHASNWHPLTWLSHMLDCSLFGVNPGAHHVVNLTLHVVNSLLLLAVLRRMTGRLGPSIWVAALFALHPLHVESVAWISERKDVLSGMFWMLTIWAYVGYVHKQNLGRYVLTFVLLVLGLMAKPMLVTLPLILLLLDFWPLGRLAGTPPPPESAINAFDRSVANPVRPASIRWLIIEKLPLFVAVTASSVVTFLVQRAGDSVMTSQSLAMPDRLANAVVAYGWYITKMLWPTGLALYYPHRSLYGGTGWPASHVVSSGLALVFIAVLVIRAARGRGYMLVGWLWYLIALVPVIGLVQVGTQSVADRYTYLPLIGLFIAVAYGLADLVERWRYRAITYVAIACVVTTSCATLAWKQVGYWQDDRTLFSRSIDVTSNNYLAHLNLGAALLRVGEVDDAIDHFERAMRIDPNQPDSYNNVAWIRATHPDAIRRNANEGLRLAEIAAGLVTAKGSRHEMRQAANVLDTLAAAYAEAGQFEHAVQTARQAIQLLPDTTPKVVAEQIERRIRLYEQGIPYRDTE